MFEKSKALLELKKNQSSMINADSDSIIRSFTALGAPGNNANTNFLATILQEGELVKAYWEGIGNFAVVTNKRLLSIKIRPGQYTSVPLGNVKEFNIIAGSTFKVFLLQVIMQDGSVLTIKGNFKPAAYPSSEFFTQTLNSLFAVKKFETGIIIENKIDPAGKVASPVAERVDEGVSLIASLKARTEKVLKENLSPNEEILAQLMGDFGQALVLTNKRLYLVKVGFMTGQTFGGKCIAYDYHNITSIEIKKHATSNILVVLTSATMDNNRLSYWSNDGSSAKESDYAITFIGDVKRFQLAVNLARDLISDAHSGGTQQARTQNTELEQLEKLAELKSKGIVTEEEFQTKKRAVTRALVPGLCG